MPWSELAQCAAGWQRADILMRLPAASFKRVNRRYPDDHLPLRDYLAAIPKRHKSVMEPHGKHQWTFLYLTNGKALDWKRIGFHDVDSTDGERIFEILTRTNSERRNDGWNQTSLFNL
jgi:hypothetical protein